MRASDEKMYFLVLVTKFGLFVLKVPEHGPTLRLRVMTKKLNFWPELRNKKSARLF